MRQNQGFFLAAFQVLSFFIIFATFFSAPASADAPSETGLDFQALLDESIQAKASLEDGLLLVSRRNTWDDMPQNHEEMVRCVDNDAEWDPDYSGFSIVGKIRHYENIHGLDDMFTYRYSGYFYVEGDKQGSWRFCTYSDDASEIEIDGRVVASWYGEHNAGCYMGEHSGAISLTEGWHHVVYRYVEKDGSETAWVEFKAPGSGSYSTFSTEELAIASYPFEEGLLLVTKKNNYDAHPSDHGQLENCVETASESTVDHFGWSVVQQIAQTENIHGQDSGYTSYYEAYFPVTEGSAGDWSFATDSGAASEIEIDGSIVASWYGDHEPLEKRFQP